MTEDGAVAALRRHLEPALGLFAAVAILTVGEPCSAQTLARNWEAGFLLSGEVTAGDAWKPGYRLVRSLGYFPTDVWEVGGALGIIGPFDAPPSSLLMLRVDHHFPLGAAALPYVGVSTGVRSDLISGDTTTAALVGVQSGMKIFLSEAIALTVELGGSFGGDGFQERGLVISIGLTQFFPPLPKPAAPDVAEVPGRTVDEPR